jgi:hypothetical protein
LAFGLLDLDRPSEGEPQTVERTLSRLHQPPGPRTIATDPTGAGEEAVDLQLGVIAPGRLELSPWPFASDTVELVAPWRCIPDRAYASAQEAAVVVREAPFIDRRALLQPGHRSPLDA